MSKRSAGNWISWIGSLILMMATSCVQSPQVHHPQPDAIVSTLFKVDGVMNGKRFRGVRAYLHVAPEGRYMLVLMTLTNSPVAAVYMDGGHGTFVDFRKKIAVTGMSNKALEQYLPFPVDTGALAACYRRAVETGRAVNRTFDWGEIIITKAGRVVALLTGGGRVLLMPVKGPEFGVMDRVALPVPAGYKVTHEPGYSLPR